MKVLAICCTSGRHSLLERSVRMFLDQDYIDKTLLIYQNSSVNQSLDESLKDKNIILINRSLDSKTNEPYKNLGDIYNDLIQYIPDDIEVVTFSDDDDVNLDGVDMNDLLLADAMNLNIPEFREKNEDDDTVDSNIEIQSQSINHGDPNVDFEALLNEELEE